MITGCHARGDGCSCPPTRRSSFLRRLSACFTALSIEVLLGVANIACWQYFVVSNALAGGYLVTVLHLGFAAAHAFAVTADRRSDEVSARLNALLTLDLRLSQI